MNGTSAVRPSRPTFADAFGMGSALGLVRAVTLSLLGARVKHFGKHTAPRNAHVASVRADVRNNKKEPIRALVELNRADIDEGVPVALVNTYLRELMEGNEQYAARKQRRESLGILPFRQRLTRKAVIGERESCESTCAVMEADASCIESLRRARAELLEEIAADQGTADLITAEIVRLEAGA